MKDETLEALLTLGLDERTNPNEALSALRAAARQFQSAGPRAPTDEEIHKAFAAEFEQVKRAIVDKAHEAYKDRIAILERERDASSSERDMMRNERDAHKKQLEDVRQHMKALYVFMTANDGAEPIGCKPFTPRPQETPFFDPLFRSTGYVQDPTIFRKKP